MGSQHPVGYSFTFENYMYFMEEVEMLENDLWHE
jgi:hypothetical protein